MRNSIAKFSTRASSLVSIRLYQEKTRLIKCSVINVGFSEIKGRNHGMWSKEICGVSSHQHLSRILRDFRASLNCNLWIILTLWVMKKNDVQSDSIQGGRQIYFSIFGCSIQWTKAFLCITNEWTASLWLLLKCDTCWNHTVFQNTYSYHGVVEVGIPACWLVSWLVSDSVALDFCNAELTNKTAWEVDCFLYKIFQLQNHWFFFNNSVNF